ncbi:response regulator transcription factor [Ekhidna sp.]|uniref:response regulator transcription factor n=1 Tax=Ekhidna sp. TaxID=2608089 RepID=UPI003CCBB855
MDYLLNHAVHPFHRMQVLNISTWSYGIAWKFKDEWGNENRDFNLSAFYKMKKSNERPIYIHRNTQILSRDSKNNVTKGITFITDVSGNFNLKQSALSACIISPYGNKITYKSKQSKIHITESEQKILHYLYHGNTSNQIASRLSISKHTVDTHRRNLLKKFQVNNTPEMLHEAINQSFI